MSRSKNVEIGIHLLAQTQVNYTDVKHWLDELGAKDYQIPPSTDPACIVALAAKQCYMSFEPGLNKNVTKVRSDLVDYLDNILKSGHGSVLEHATYTFGINNVSRVFTGEMNRHRAGWAISERSMRFIRYGESIPWWLPTSLVIKEGDDAGIIKKKQASQELFHQAFTHQSMVYEELMNLWDMDEGDKNFHYKKTITSCLRRIIGMGVATGGVWTGNIRALRHVIAMRASPAAEEEIFHVFSRIAEMMVLAEPMLFGDFKRDGKGFWACEYEKV